MLGGAYFQSFDLGRPDVLVGHVGAAVDLTTRRTTPLTSDAGGNYRFENVDRDNFYGLASDFEEIKGTMFTARFEHDFNDRVSLRNTSRYGKLRQFYVLSGVNALTVTDPDPDLWTVARTRHGKFQENTLLTNQTNITANLGTGSVTHAITGGLYSAIVQATARWRTWTA